MLPPPDPKARVHKLGDVKVIESTPTFESIVSGLSDVTAEAERIEAEDKAAEESYIELPLRLSIKEARHILASLKHANEEDCEGCSAFVSSFVFGIMAFLAEGVQTFDQAVADGVLDEGTNEA